MVTSSPPLSVVSVCVVCEVGPSVVGSLPVGGLSFVGSAVVSPVAPGSVAVPVAVLVESSLVVGFSGVSWQAARTARISGDGTNEARFSISVREVYHRSPGGGSALVGASPHGCNACRPMHAQRTWGKEI
jgi:hypothetical protein